MKYDARDHELKMLSLFQHSSQDRLWRQRIRSSKLKTMK